MVAGKVVLLTGVGQNMGLATARWLASAGAKVVVSDLSRETALKAATAVASSLDGNVEAIDGDTRHDWASSDSEGILALTGDVRKQDDCHQLVQRVVDSYGQIDVLVNCAGRSSFGLALEMNEALFDQEIETNLKGNFLIARAAARVMVDAGRGGRLILFSSGAAESARRGGISHCSSKAGINMIVKVMAIELGEYDITVNAISPGLVPKPDRHVSSQEYRDAMLRSIPLGRLGKADDVSGAVEFLASDAASWITGEILHVNGGSLAGRAGMPVSVDKPTSSFSGAGHLRARERGTARRSRSPRSDSGA